MNFAPLKRFSTCATIQHGTVKEALEAYESVRKPPTSAIMLSSRVIGFVETGAGPVGLVRDAAFAALGTAVGRMQVDASFFYPWIERRIAFSKE